MSVLVDITELYASGFDAFGLAALFAPVAVGLTSHFDYYLIHTLEQILIITPCYKTGLSGQIPTFPINSTYGSPSP